MEDGKKLGYALGALFGGLSALCGLIVYASPQLAMKLLEMLTHSSWAIAMRPFNAMEYAVGIALWWAIGYALGWMFSWLCGCCREKNPRKMRK